MKVSNEDGGNIVDRLKKVEDQMEDLCKIVKNVTNTLDLKNSTALRMEEAEPSGGPPTSSRTRKNGRRKKRRTNNKKPSPRSPTTWPGFLVVLAVCIASLAVLAFGQGGRRMIESVTSFRTVEEDGGSPLPTDTTVNEQSSIRPRALQAVDTAADDTPSPAQTAGPARARAQDNHLTPEVPSTGGGLFGSAPVDRTPKESSARSLFDPLSDADASSSPSTKTTSDGTTAATATPFPTTSETPAPTICTGSTPNCVDELGDGCDWYEEEDLPVSTSYSPELFVYVGSHL